MLDTIAILENPDQTALVEMHSVSGNFGYCAEAAARLSFYNFLGYPSLFLDGVDLWPISTWRPSISTRIATPSPLTLTITGSYNAGTNTGTINASYRNDSTSTISGRVYFVITEDSLYNVDPNGHAWHNHVARDYLPDQTGEATTINVGQTVTRTRNFTINAAWNENRCYIVTWLQANAPSRNGYQAGEVRVTNLIGLEEENIADDVYVPKVALLSNPCSAKNVRFALNLTKNSKYSIDFFDITGRRVNSIEGVARGEGEIINCNLNDGMSGTIPAGIYLYLFDSETIYTTGKIIVK